MSLLAPRAFEVFESTIRQRGLKETQLSETYKRVYLLKPHVTNASRRCSSFVFFCSLVITIQYNTELFQFLLCNNYLYY